MRNIQEVVKPLKKHIWRYKLEEQRKKELRRQDEEIIAWNGRRALRAFIIILAKGVQIKDGKFETKEYFDCYTVVRQLFSKEYLNYLTSSREFLEALKIVKNRKYRVNKI